MTKTININEKQVKAFFEKQGIDFSKQKIGFVETKYNDKNKVSFEIEVIDR
jgi:hypothetical protein